ncbi:YdbL family protein [Iodidimonas sp. SYSU 1G8]|uniref:YdbL family protein n=1 Tax=Iodidimonas sp. SYSU 1G8 TaxID=3133967 RepID=UPI0031FE4821
MLKIIALCLVAAGGIAVYQAAPAYAQSRPLDAPRAAGVIGERYDGFAVVRDAKGGADMRALVESTNEQRRALYAEKAKEQGAPVEEVGKVYAKEILAKAPAGTWFQGPDGGWSQK